MEAVIVEVGDDGRVKYANEEGWSRPTLQERRAILYAAQKEIDALTELIERVQGEELTGRDAVKPRG
jgi:hypothetical protein